MSPTTVLLGTTLARTIKPHKRLRLLGSNHLPIYRIADDLLITGQGDTMEDADKDHDANLVNLL